MRKNDSPEKTGSNKAKTKVYFEVLKQSCLLEGIQRLKNVEVIVSNLKWIILKNKINFKGKSVFFFPIPSTYHTTP